MKLEIAKFDSILQGNLLLDKASHKISDILLLDKVRMKQEFPGRPHLDKLGCDASDSSISPHSVPPESQPIPLKQVQEDLVTCKWEECGERLEPQHLLDHITVSSSARS